VTDRLGAVGEPALREALLYARGRRTAFTADEAAGALGVHRNVARSRFERLAAAGLLEAAYERRTGRSGPGAGRPAKVYSVSPEVDAIEFPARRYEKLVGALLDALGADRPPELLRRAGESFGRELAAAAGLRPATGVRAGLERVCDAVGRLGFQASLVEVAGDTAVIATPTCPLRPLVAERPEAAELDRGMWAGLVERAVTGLRAERVECETANCSDGHASCRVLLRLQDASASGETESR
jgi:predicted ArsR family transcriptional regulator